MKRILISGNFDFKEWIDVANKLYGKVLVDYDGDNSSTVKSKTYDVVSYDEEYLKSIKAKVKIVGEFHVSDIARSVSLAKFKFESARCELDKAEQEHEKYCIAMMDYVFYSKIGECMNGKCQSKLYDEIREYNVNCKKIHELLKQLHYRFEYKDKKLCILGR